MQYDHRRFIYHYVQIPHFFFLSFDKEDTSKYKIPQYHVYWAMHNSNPNLSNNNIIALIHFISFNNGISVRMRERELVCVWIINCRATHL